VPNLLSLKRVAEALGVHVNTVRNYMTRCGLPWVALSPRRIAIDARDLERWIAARKRTAGS
jgi:predicted site-specific integrase-resolvase